MANLSDILRDVRILLDHNETFQSIEGLEDDQLYLDGIIENQVEAAARMLVMTSPRDYLHWEVLTAGSGDGEHGVYVIPLPSDYLRFGAAKLTQWKKAVDTCSSVDSDAYAQQQSEFAGVRATARKPVVIVREHYPSGTTSPLGSEAMLYPFGGENDSLEFFTYCRQPKLVTVNSQKTIDITDTLYQPFIYMLGAMVAEVLKDTEKSNELMAAAKAMVTAGDGGEKTTNQ